MSYYDEVKNRIAKESRRWLVTGVAGFIGSHLLEHLLILNQSVTGLDNFSIGKRNNLEDVKSRVSPGQWSRFRFIEGDIRDPAVCRESCENADIVLHEAALGSIPRSLENPVASNDNNVTGTLNLFVSARDNKVKRVIYATSSSTYGDHGELPQREDRRGKLLSPYAVTKVVNELYADVFARCYGLETIGLRYFNVFGPRQNSEGAYAAVIPRWIAAMIKNEPVYVNGTGDTSRDFCYIENAVQMNLLAAAAEGPEITNQIYNTGVNARTSLNELFEMLRSRLEEEFKHVAHSKLMYRDYRPGDLPHSHADINKAKRLLRYEPTHTLEQGLDETVSWYRRMF
jgi:UDP-N-acetylglucosamine 4-epimerase